MNRAWIALLGLAALGVVGLDYQTRPYDWPDGPIYVAEAGALLPSKCRGWQSRAARRPDSRALLKRSKDSRGSRGLAIRKTGHAGAR